VARAEQLKHVAVLTGLGENDPATRQRLAAFQQGLAALGWREGGNLAIDVRYEPSSADRARRLATELVALRPDIGVAQGLPSVVAMREANPSVPLVFVAVPDPVSTRVVESLARPGGNVTGLTSNEPSFGGKWIELLKEIAPGVRRVLVLSQQNPVIYGPSLLEASSRFAIELAYVRVNSDAEIQAAIDGFAGGGEAGGLILPTDLYTASRRAQIIALAAHHKLPLITGNPPFPPDGGLMYYGADFVDLYRRAAGYVDRILRGAPAADLPVQLPVAFQLTINLKTAADLRLTVSPALRARADEVFE
jgi:putative ABC transport system substrate-binding protein